MVIGNAERSVYTSALLASWQLLPLETLASMKPGACLATRARECMGEPTPSVPTSREHRRCLQLTKRAAICLSHPAHSKDGYSGRTDKAQLSKPLLRFFIAEFDACLAIPASRKQGLQQYVELDCRDTSWLQNPRQTSGCVPVLCASTVCPARNGRIAVQVGLPTLLVGILLTWLNPSHGGENLL